MPGVLLALRIMPSALSLYGQMYHHPKKSIQIKLCSWYSAFNVRTVQKVKLHQAQTRDCCQSPCAYCTPVILSGNLRYSSYDIEKLLPLLAQKITSIEATERGVPMVLRCYLVISVIGTIVSHMMLNDFLIHEEVSHALLKLSIF